MCRSTSGSCSVTPRVWPAGRMVTLATGSACSDSAATMAWPDSCTATACFSSGSSTLEPSRRPRMIRSRAASKSAALITSRLSRTALMAASLTRLARSAPENPGVPRATEFRSTPGASFLPRQCTARISARSVTFGSGIVTCRSNRPGRSRAGSRTSGRLVAARTTMPADGLEPVHLGQQLVERLLALVVGHHRAGAGPALADGVDLVDEDDGGRALAGLIEQVTDPGRADADEQLHEAGPGDREEQHPAPRPRPRGPAASCRCRAARPSARRAAPARRPGRTGPGCAGSPPPRRSRPWRPRSRPHRRTWWRAAPRRTPWPGTGRRPATPCRPPAALRDIRDHSQPKNSSGRPKISSQLSTSEPKLVPDVGADTVHVVGLQLGQQRLVGLRRDDHRVVGPAGQRAGAGAARAGRCRWSSPCARTRR